MLRRRTSQKQSTKPAAGINVERKAEEAATKIEGTLRERAMLVRFSIGRWYGTGADDDVTAAVKEKHNARGDIGTFTKRFMSREYLAAINQVTNEARKYHKSMTLAWGDSGQRLLSADVYFEYKKEMTAFEMRFNAAVEEFLAQYDQHKAKEKQRLNGLFKERDYPSHEELQKRFRFALEVQQLPSAEDFRVDLGAQEVERIKASIEAQVAEAVQEASRDLWERLHDLVGKLKERLSSSDAQLRGSLFENLRDLVQVLPKLNITHDPKLKAMGDEIAKELLSSDVGAVREDDAVRRDVAKKADKILSSMESFLGKKS